MDVVCGRCRAEYEFDNALISERGTTVRCTNCGLQFKVFPPVGVLAPEVWVVFDPRDKRVEPIRYDSLRAMQKDIARGVVTAAHLLARGDEAPRPLSEIVELEPLLQQPKSEPPPPFESVPGPEAPPAPAGTKTVLGIVQRPNPGDLSGAPAPPRSPLDSNQDVDDQEIVPAEPADSLAPVTPESPLTPQSPRDAKPRIRSALSMSPTTARASATRSDDKDEAESSELEARASIPPPRQSLRQTLASSTTSQRPSPVPGESGPPSSRAGKPNSERGKVAPPQVAELPGAAEEAEPKPSRAAAVAVTLPFEPTISEAAQHPAHMTPTPTGMRAYRAPDAEPVSSIAGVHVKQRARTGGIVLAVFVGGAAFLGFANRDKLTGALPAAESEGAKAETQAREVPSDLAARLQMVDASWISTALLKNAEGKFPAPRAAHVESLLKEVAALGADSSWEKVNLLRALGRLEEARAAAGSLEKGADQSYALALLELAEAKEDPPWPVVVERLREASSGERGLFLARSAYIYSLAASGALPQARADFEALGQIAAGKDAPLYSELRAYLERLGAFESETEDPASATSPVVEPEPVEPEPVELEPAAPERVLDQAASPSNPQEAPVAAPEKSETKTVAVDPERATAQKVPDAIKAQVDEADAMWRGGNQEGALVIYRKVVAKIGTTHFLGQRSAARIAQAERERAAAK